MSALSPVLRAFGLPTTGFLRDIAFATLVDSGTVTSATFLVVRGWRHLSRLIWGYGSTTTAPANVGDHSGATPVPAGCDFLVTAAVGYCVVALYSLFDISCLH